ncbi:MAG: GntR family transcriptional regulator [Chloroflexota bacterium]
MEIADGSKTRSGAVDVAYRQLKELIIRNELPPASSISESDLAALVGISRTPLREALRLLAAEGFICRLSNGRLTVAATSIKEVRELYQVRSALESLVVEAATPKLTDEWEARLRHLQHANEVLARAGLIAEAVKQGDAFHFALVELADNAVATVFLTQLRERLRRYRQVASDFSPERAIAAAEEHLELLEMIVARRPEEAAGLMRRHIQNSTRALFFFLEERTEVSH